MQLSLKTLPRAALPAVVFAVVWAIHLGWVGWVHPPACAEPGPPGAEPCACEESGGMADYLASGSYWLGYAYGLSLAFAGVALRRYREQRLCADRSLAIGGVTLSGFLALAGCFLVGCCGSPMLGVYLSLFGASFLPWAKPLVGGVTTVMIAVSYWWMCRRSHANHASPTECARGRDCGCNTPSSSHDRR